MHCCVVTLHNVTSILLQYMPKPIMMHWRHWTDDMSTIERHPADCNIGSIYTLWDPSPIIAFPCHSLLIVSWIDPFVSWISLSCNLGLSKLIHGFLSVVTWICRIWWMNLLNWYSHFFYVVTWICQSCYMDLLKFLYGCDKAVTCISQPLPNKTELKFDQDFKDCWNVCSEIKLLIESKHWMPWAHCAVGNVFLTFFVLRPPTLSVIALRRGQHPQMNRNVANK